MSAVDREGGARRRGHWYMHLYDDPGPRGRVQTDGFERRTLREPRFTLPEHVLRLAQAEYDRQFPGQPYERMQERGGLGVTEVIGLLADYLDRLGAQPSTPRGSGDTNGN